MPEATAAPPVIASNGQTKTLAEERNVPTVGEVQGASGIVFSHGTITNTEFNSKLTGTKRIDLITQMRADAQVGAAEEIVCLPIKSSNWTIEAEDPTVEEELKDQFFRRLNFKRILDKALLAFSYGFELMEKQYVVDNGKYWYKGLHHRGQETITKWNPDKDGSLKSVEQRVWKEGQYRTVTMGADNLFHLAYQGQDNNFVGRSGLRKAYKPWFIKETVEKINAIALERLAIGVPVITSPRDYSEKDATSAKNMAKNYRGGAHAHLFLPNGWSFVIAGQGDSQRYDPMPTIKYYDEMISMSVLAMVLSMGRTQTGGWALSRTMLDLFEMGLRAIADWIKDACNEQLIDPLKAINYANGTEIAASFVWSDLEVQSVEAVSTALERLERSRFITPQEGDESWVRSLLKAPQPERDPSQTARRPGARHLHSDNCDHDHGTRRLAATDRWREPTDLERSMALNEIAGRQDDAQDEVVDLSGKVRAVWVDNLVQQISEALADGDPTDVADIEIPRALRREKVSDLVALERELYRFGRQTVRDEAKRQARRANLNVDLDAVWSLRDDPIEPTEVSQRMRTRARTFLEKLASRITSVAQEMAQGLHRTKREDFEQSDLDTITNDLTGMFDTAARNQSATLVSESFNMGRDRQAMEMKEQVQQAVFSAILDGSVCEECEALDGNEYQVDTPEYYAVAPPNPRCQSTLGGENQCRCLFVYEFALPEEDV